MSTAPEHVPVLLDEIVEWLAPCPWSGHSVSEIEPSAAGMHAPVPDTECPDHVVGTLGVPQRNPSTTLPLGARTTPLAAPLPDTECPDHRIIVDGTLGGGGHARALAERVGPGGRVIALDRDPAAVEAARRLLAGFPVTLVAANYAEIPEVLAGLGISAVDGLLLDLGLSSDQVADAARGFSFHATGPLDLRFNPEEGEPAARLVNRLSAEHLADLIFQYGEERHSRRIARAIVEARRRKPIESADQLAEVVRRSVPRPPRGERIDAATRTFQALRIAVNDELKWLEVALRRLPGVLRPGARIAVISFHSLEDRRVKEAFRDDPRLAVLTRKPLRASDAETARNPRSRSAKLRVAERVVSPP